MTPTLARAGAMRRSSVLAEQLAADRARAELVGVDVDVVIAGLAADRPRERGAHGRAAARGAGIAARRLLEPDDDRAVLPAAGLVDVRADRATQVGHRDPPAQPGPI